MNQHRFGILIAGGVAVLTMMGLCAEPVAVSGTFVQRKVLKDIDVTLSSTGTWSFEKDRAFEWRTLKPMPSLFVATPTK